MIFFSKKRYFTGGKRKIPVRRVSATSVEDFDRLLGIVQALPTGSWWGWWPTHEFPWDWNSRLQPCVMVRDIHLYVLTEEFAVELPETYADLLMTWLRKDYWDEQWHGFGRERGPQARVYWTQKLRWRVGRIFKSGEWISDPCSYEPDTECDRSVLIPGLKMINGRIENFDLGQRRPVNPHWNDPEMDPEPKMESQSDDPNVAEYFQLPVDAREAYLEAKPWIKSLLISRGIIHSGDV